MNPSLLSSASAMAIVVTADDGGCGKTTFAVQIATLFRLSGVGLSLHQLDSKEKLAAKTGLSVQSLSVSRAGAERGDELIASDVIAPWYRAVTAMNENGGGSVLLEVGGANAALFHAAVTEFDLQEDVELLGLDIHVFVVTKAGEDSAIQAIREVKRLEANLPGASIVIVRNEVLGCPVAAAEFLDDRLKKAFLGLLKKYPSVRMPKVRARSMALYERLHVTPDVIVGWHVDNYREAIERTTKPRDEVKIFVKDIAAWSAVMLEEIARVLPKLASRSDG
jgi:hypothetical protein